MANFVQQYTPTPSLETMHPVDDNNISGIAMINPSSSNESTFELEPACILLIFFGILSCLTLLTGAPTTNNDSSRNNNSNNNDLSLPLLQKDTMQSKSKKNDEDNDDEDEDNEENKKEQRIVLYRIGVSLILLNFILIAYQCLSLANTTMVPFDNWDPICWVYLMAVWVTGISTSWVAIAESQQWIPDNSSQHFLCFQLVVMSYYAVMVNGNQKPKEDKLYLEIAPYHINMASVVAIVYWTKNKRKVLFYFLSMALLALAQMTPLVCGMETCYVPLPGEVVTPNSSTGGTDKVASMIMGFFVKHFDVFYFSGAILLLCHACFYMKRSEVAQK